MDKDGYVEPISVELGLTDGSRTEIAGPEVKAGLEVGIGEETAAGQENNPFLPPIRFGRAAPAMVPEKQPVGDRARRPRPPVPPP